MTEDTKTPKQVLLEQLSKWIDDLQLGDEKCDFRINTPQRIDPEKGILQQAFIIEVARQMERVADEESQTEPDGLPPIPEPAVDATPPDA